MHFMLKVLYENKEILVCDKPSGLAVQPGAGITVSVIDILKQELPYEPFLVHRLDRDTSGVLVVAKDRIAAGKFSRLMAAGSIHKEYLAVCAGKLKRKAGLITEKIVQHGVAKSAETRFKVTREIGDFSILELELGTGRMHQIRIHLAGLGHPIIGDDVHGDFKLNRELRKAYGIKKLLLHARRIVVPTNQAVEAPLPEHFTNFLARLEMPPAVTGEPKTETPPKT
jgi:23S rRNA pseudouridine955/2504/2580 synthase